MQKPIVFNRIGSDTLHIGRKVYITLSNISDLEDVMTKAQKTWAQPKLTELSVTETLAAVNAGSMETLTITNAGSTLAGRCCS